MADRDELLFGAMPVAAPDSDGDGVSDMQERLDGTDPNDSSSVVHHLDATIATADPQGDLAPASLDGQVVVDVASAAPAGFSDAQPLGTGLDGKPIQTDPNHLGVGNDTPLAGRADSNSVTDVQRDPTLTGPSTTPSDGRDPLTETMGRTPGPSATTEPAVRGGLGDAPPPGEPASGSADPDHNPELVSGYISDLAVKAGSLAGGVARGLNIIAHDVLQAPKDFVTNFEMAATQPIEPPPPPPPPPADPPKTSVDPDAPGATVVTSEDLARAVAVHGAATDVVQGFGGTQIEGDAPPKQAIDFVRDPIEKDSTLSVTTPTPSSTGQEISHTINPDAGFDPGRAPSTGPPASGGVDAGLYGSTSSAATAVDAATGSASDTGDISVVGASSTAEGIHTVVGDTAAVPDSAAGDAGRASESSPMMAASGPGTQTEDEVYIGAPSTPPDGPNDDGASGAAGGPSASDSLLGLAPSAVGQAEVAVTAPAFEVPSYVTSVDSGDTLGGPIPDDAATDAPPDAGSETIDSAQIVPVDEPAPTFTVLEVDDGLAIPDQVDLDDGF